MNKKEVLDLVSCVPDDLFETAYVISIYDGQIKLQIEYNAHVAKKYCRNGLIDKCGFVTVQLIDKPIEITLT